MSNRHELFGVEMSIRGMMHPKKRSDNIVVDQTFNAEILSFVQF